MIRRLTLVNLALALLGVTVAGLWVWLIGGPEHLRDLLLVDTRAFALLVCLTGSCVFVRFVRWQYLLRSVNVRIPTRASLSIFLASLAGMATPAYVGELVRATFMRRRFGVPARITVSVLVVERLFDVVALGMIGVLTAPSGWMRTVMGLLVITVPVVAVAAARLARSVGVPKTVVADLGKTSTLARALLGSLFAWALAALLITAAAVSLGVWVSPIRGMGIFSTATLLGAVTLMPAGVGATGTLAILQLQDLGVAVGQAVLVVSLVRLATVGVAISVSAVFLAVEFAALRRRVKDDGTTHFDEIASDYDQQFSEHVWRRLLDRKVSLLTSALPKTVGAAHLGLDLGCGLGEQCLELGRRGYNVIGVDAAQGLVQRASQAGATAAAGNALALPFRDASFDFVFTVGVLHHLSGAEEQEAACREVLRVLKPGGHFIVHETNPRNPLFRFYMGYVFPILRTIDMGTEWWIQPERWKHVQGLHLVALDYFTFLPDFIPRWLMGLSGQIERYLESSPLRPFSVHYMATARKPSPAQATRYEEPRDAPLADASGHHRLAGRMT